MALEFANTSIDAAVALNSRISEIFSIGQRVAIYVAVVTVATVV
jgi:hypothetical protein